MIEAPLRRRRPDEVRLAVLPPLSLYVHMPWCLRKCPYCDFNSHARPDVLPERRYLDALVADLDAALPQVWGRRVASIFIGGGTPSLFAPESIDALVSAVRARLPLAPDGEITLEANPGSFERERFRAFRAAGVNRLSIGVQSFDDAALRALGRVHDAAQAHAALAEAAACFERFNIDLMYALPEQTPAALERDLDAALAYAPPHLSVYQLTIEPNTRFALAPPPLPDDEVASAMLDCIVERTAAAGLERYEVSAFALAGRRCVHNLNYWEFGDYLGIGAGAHGKLSTPTGIVRQVRWRDPARYVEQALAGNAVSNETTVAAAELPFEYLLNALRLRAGTELARFTERTGLAPGALEPGLTQAIERGWLEMRGTRLVPTARGYDFLNDVLALFLDGRGGR